MDLKKVQEYLSKDSAYRTKDRPPLKERVFHYKNFCITLLNEVKQPRTTIRNHEERMADENERYAKVCPLKEDHWSEVAEMVVRNSVQRRKEEELDKKKEKDRRKSL